MNVRKTDAFIADVERQFEWYVLNAGWQLANRYLDAVEATCRLLEKHPHLHSSVLCFRISVSMVRVWQQLGRLVVETPATAATDAEFDAALDEVTGCTARRNATGRLLEERQLVRQRDQDQLQARRDSRTHA